MVKKVSILVLIISLCSGFYGVAAVSADDLYKTVMKRDLLCLMAAYPEYIVNIDSGSDGQVYIVMQSGRKILYDDRKVKTHDQKLACPDLQDMMEQVYPLNELSHLPDIQYDPGRCRVYELLNEVYGQTRTKIEANLKCVSTGGGQFLFNVNNNASASLKSTARELIALAKSSSKIASCYYPCNGTYNYRKIAGTNRLSAHAFGIAIDLSRDSRDYWRWASREKGEQRMLSYPKEIVRAFERNNFIWGGKWGHFDILHFEYRPEIVLKARFFGNLDEEEQVWYKGVPNDPFIDGCIETIEQALG